MTDEERAPPAAELKMPADFTEWVQSLHRVFRANLSIHNLRVLWEERNAALAAERERCAVLCERQMNPYHIGRDANRMQSEAAAYTAATDKCATAIRALGDGDD